MSAGGSSSSLCIQNVNFFSFLFFSSAGHGQIESTYASRTASGRRTAAGALAELVGPVDDLLGGVVVSARLVGAVTNTIAEVHLLAQTCGVASITVKFRSLGEHVLDASDLNIGLVNMDSEKRI